jgi:predicted permease
VNPWSRFVRTLSSLSGHGPVDRDLDVEMAGYVDMLVDEKTATGLGPEEARRRALLELGGAEQVKEDVRAARPAAWLDHLVRDAGFGVRLLRKTPGFSMTAILILALGIGANVAMFGLVNILLLQPRVGSDQPGEAVGIYVHDPKAADSYRPFSFQEHEEIRRRAAAFEHIAGYDGSRVALSDGAASRPARILLITADYFAALGVRPVAGRAFSEDECRPGSGAAVAVASAALADTLGGAASAVGRTVSLNSRPFTVVGVAPRGFSGTLVAFGPCLWVPLGSGTVLSGSGSADPQELRTRRTLQIVGRLEPGVAIEQAGSALRSLSGRLDGERPAGGTHEVLTAHALARTEDGTEPKDDEGLIAPLAMLAGMAAILLLVASLNVANMQLARGASRRREIAMRLALGAPRLRIASQLFAESLLLSLAAGSIGLLIGTWALRLVAASIAPIVDEAMGIVTTPDWRVVVAALGFSSIAAAVFALGPVWRMTRMDPMRGLQLGSRSDTAAGDEARIGPRHLLVAGQVALSLALLSAAGLFVRAAVISGRAEPGYTFAGQVLARVDASGQGEARQRDALRGVLDHLRSMPGVAAASVATLVAFTNESRARQVGRAGQTGEGPIVLAQQFSVGSSYFGTLGLPVLRGREFTIAEEQAAAPSHPIVIDEPLARALFPGQDPLGRQLAFPAAPGVSASASEPMEIVGVVPGLRHRLTDRGPVMHVYRPIGEQAESRVDVHVRLARPGADTAAMQRNIRRAILAVDDRLAVLSVTTLAEARDGSPVSWLIRTAGRTLGVLGIIGLAMAVVGLYGLKAYLVSRRTREIGVRLALGATSDHVIAMVLRDGSGLLAAGVILGIVGALGAGLVVGRLVVGVHPLDPLVVGLASSTLMASVLVASYLPARRATRVDPVVALRTE